MRSLTIAALSAALFFALASAVSPSLAFAQSSVATATLFHDTDSDGVLGSSGDNVIDSVVVNSNGSYLLDADMCTDCGVVVDGWGWDDPEIDSVGGMIAGDGQAPTAGTATFWLDTDLDGVFGSSGDVSLTSMDLDAIGEYEITEVSFADAGLVIDGWGWDDPEIDYVGGTLDGWGWDDPEIDSGATTDWGFGDDEIDSGAYH